MKKMMIATLALVSATVMAAPKTETKVADPTNGQPAVVLNVYDFSSKSPLKCSKPCVLRYFWAYSQKFL